jgi:cysteine synthase
MIVIPETQSPEKKDSLRLCGAQVVEVPALPFSNPNNYQHLGRRLAKLLLDTEPGGVLFADQWNNLDNVRAHYESTGPEIWQQTGGNVDGFVCSVGTCGTLAGISSYFKERNKQILIACADPLGAAMYELFKNGRAKASDGGSITEGIGLGRKTPLTDLAEVDDAYLISDEEALPIIHDLQHYEGLNVGGSTGINIAGAIRLAKKLGPGKTVVTILCDSGARYASKLFNVHYLRSKKLPTPSWLNASPEYPSALPYLWLRADHPWQSALLPGTSRASKKSPGLHLSALSDGFVILLSGTVASEWDCPISSVLE